MSKKKETEVTENIVTAAAQVASEAASEEIPEGGFIYVGPTVANFAVQNAVYTDIPSEARERFPESPLLRNLFIPITDWPKANEMIRTQSGYIWTAWQAAVSLRPNKRFKKKETE